MNIKIISLQDNLLTTEKEYLEKKLARLEKLTRHFKDKADLEVVVKKILPQETGDVFSAKAKFMIPGKDLFCQVTGNDINTLGDKLKDKLRSLIISQKGEKVARWRRMTRVFKRRREF